MKKWKYTLGIAIGLILLIIGWRLWLAIFLILVTLISFGIPVFLFPMMIGTEGGRDYSKTTAADILRTAMRIWYFLVAIWLILSIPAIAERFSQWVPSIPLAYGWKGALWVIGLPLLGMAIGRLAITQRLLRKISQSISN